MNILVYCDDSGLGGTAVNAALLAESFVQAGHDVVLVSGERPNPYACAGVPAALLGYDPVLFPAKARLSRNEPEALFLRQRPDLVFFCDSAPDASLAAKAVCRDWGIAYVVLVNYVTPDVPPRFAAFFECIERAYAGALAVVAVSRQNLRLLRDHYGVSQQRSGVVYNGRPREYFEPFCPERRAALRASLGLGPQDILCLTVARYEARKGYPYLLEAAAELAARPGGQRLYYAWIGHDLQGWRDRLTRAVAERGLGSRIWLTGQRDDVRDWLGAADLFVLPSESEGMPLCLVEAMGQGLPVVATAVSGIPEQLGQAGILLPDPLRDRPGMVAALIEALAALAADPAGRRRLGQAGRQRAEALFSAEAMLAGYRDLLTRLEAAVRAAKPRYPDPAGARIRNALRPGQDILVGQDAASVEYLRSGWSHAEGEGRWTDGERAVVAFGLPAGACQGYVVQFEAKPFLGQGDAVLDVGISFCGRERGRLRWPPLPNETRCFDFVFFPDGPLPAEGELVFTFRGASSPLAQGLSDDARTLGLRLTRLRLDRLATPCESPWPG